MSEDLRIEGLEICMLNLNNALSKIKNVSMRAIQDCADDLLSDAKSEAPIKTGTLRRSGFVRKISNGYEIGFGGEASNYAIVQHERLDFSHPRGGKAKYLEDPFKRNLKAYINYIGDKSKV